MSVFSQLGDVIKQSLSEDKKTSIYYPSSGKEVSDNYSGLSFVETCRIFLSHKVKLKKQVDFIFGNRSINCDIDFIDSIKDSEWDSKSDNSIQKIYRKNGVGGTLKIREAYLENKFLNDIREFFGLFMTSPLGLNLYFTSSNAKLCIPAHRDVGDIFIIQLEGKKKWFVEQTVSDVDVSSDPLSIQLLNITHTMKSGDVLFLPRQLAHRTKTFKSDSSLHMTIQGNSDILTWFIGGLKHFYNKE